MPLIRFDLIEGRTEKEIADLLDAEKQSFYRLPCEALQQKCGIAPSDVMVSIVENKDADWSFGNARRSSSPASSAAGPSSEIERKSERAVGGKGAMPSNPLELAGILPAAGWPSGAIRQARYRSWRRAPAPRCRRRAPA